MKSKKQKWLSVLAIICIGMLIFSACQPTPETPPVVNRLGGLPKNSILPRNQDAQQKEIDYPNHWTEVLTRANNQISIHADLAISVADISNTAVIEMMPSDISNDKLKTLAEYFAPKQKTYKKPAWTKSLLQKHINLLQKGEGIYAGYDKASIDIMCAKLEEFLVDAPDKPMGKTYVAPEFTAEILSETEHMYSAIMPNATNAPPDEETSFYVLVDTDDVRQPLIRARRGNELTNKGNLFEYSEVNDVFSEGELWRLREQIRTQTEKKGTVAASKDMLELAAEQQEYVDLVQQAIDKTEYFPAKQAEIIALKVLKDLGITDVALFKTEKSLFNETPRIEDETLSDTMYPQPTGTEMPAYTLNFSRNVDGVAAFQQMQGINYGSLPEVMYTPPFYQETLTMVIDASGVKNFHWRYMAQPTKIIAENTQLLPFNEIKESFANHIFYTNAPPSEDIPIGDLKYIVKSVELRYVYINAFEQPTRTWLVPAWVFEVDQYFDFGTDKDYTFIMPETMVINAIDGGYITMPTQ